MSETDIDVSNPSEVLNVIIEGVPVPPDTWEGHAVRKIMSSIFNRNGFVEPFLRTVARDRSVPVSDKAIANIARTLYEIVDRTNEYGSAQSVSTRKDRERDQEQDARTPAPKRKKTVHKHSHPESATPQV